MKKNIFFLFFIIGFFPFAVCGQVVINEILYNPEQTPEHIYEWIEIYNTEAYAVNLSSWSFIVGTKSYYFTPVNQSAAIIQGTSYGVFVSSASAFLAMHPDFSASLYMFTKTVRLSNTGNTIALIDAYGIVIDSVTYQPEWNNDVENKSVERKNTNTSGADCNNWQESFGFGGTPGMQNSVGVIIEEDLSDDNITPYATAAQQALITEVAPSRTNSADWIEIYIREETNSGLLSLYEQNVEIKKFPAGVIPKGSFIIVHLNETGTDELTDSNTNRYLDFYSSDDGLTGTDNVISIRDSSGNIMDAVIFSNQDSESFVPESSYDTCAAAGIWYPVVTTRNIDDYEANSFDWSQGGSNMSISRKRTADGYPDDTRPGTKDCWVLNLYPNPGCGYGNSNNSFSTVLDVAEPNPFSPDDDDLSKRYAHINFRVAAGSVKTLYVFDVHGRERVKLINQDAGITGESWQGVDEGEVLWDGRDNKGEKLTVGIYIVYMEAVNPATGSKQKGKDTIVIGGKLK